MKLHYCPIRLFPTSYAFQYNKMEQMHKNHYCYGYVSRLVEWQCINCEVYSIVWHEMIMCSDFEMIGEVGIIG
jgi:hypothetical protein